MKPLNSNRDLYDYLLLLASLLEQQGLHALSEAVMFASAQAAGLSTEFLGESRIALRRVRDEGADALGGDDRNDLLDVLRQLDEALDSR
jgi:hypothetical protein